MHRTLIAPLAGFAGCSTLAALLVLAAGSRSGAEARDPGPDIATVNTLDRLWQERFQTVDYKNFGVSRIAPTLPPHPAMRHFKPETDVEKGAVQEMQDSGWDAALLVVGRNALRYVRQPGAAEPSGPAGAAVSLDSLP